MSFTLIWRTIVARLALVAGLVVALACAVAAHAQNPAGTDSADTWHSAQSTQALLSALTQKAQREQSLNGRFTQRKQLSGLPVPLIAHGFYEYSSASGLRWVTETPIKSQLKITDNGISGVDKNNSTRVVGEIFLAVIRGDLSQLQQYFTVQSRGDSTRWTLRLTPADSALGSYLAHIDVSGAALTERVFMLDNNGDSSEITLSAKSDKPPAQASVTPINESSRAPQ